jgi:hypothetical protein
VPGIHEAKNNILFGRLTGVLALVVVGAVPCASPASESSPDPPPALSASPAMQSDPVITADEEEALDPEATQGEAETAVGIDPDMQAVRGIAATSVRLDVDAFAEISSAAHETSI